MVMRRPAGALQRAKMTPVVFVSTAFTQQSSVIGQSEWLSYCFFNLRPYKYLESCYSQNVCVFVLCFPLGVTLIPPPPPCQCVKVHTWSYLPLKPGDIKPVGWAAVVCRIQNDWATDCTFPPHLLCWPVLLFVNYLFSSLTTTYYFFSFLYTLFYCVAPLTPWPYGGQTGQNSVLTWMPAWLQR